MQIRQVLLLEDMSAGEGRGETVLLIRLPVAATGYDYNMHYRQLIDSRFKIALFTRIIHEMTLVNTKKACYI